MKEQLDVGFDLDEILEETRRKKFLNKNLDQNFKDTNDTSFKFDCDFDRTTNCEDDENVQNCEIMQLDLEEESGHQDCEINNVLKLEPQVHNFENNLIYKDFRNKGNSLDDNIINKDFGNNVVDVGQVNGHGTKKFDVKIDFDKQDLLIDDSLLYDESSNDDGTEENNLLKNFLKKESKVRYSFDGGFDAQDDECQEEKVHLNQSQVFEILKQNKKYLLKKVVLLILAFLISVTSICMSCNYELGFDKVNVFAIFNFISLLLVSISCHDVIINGFICLFKKKSSFDVISSFAYIFNVIQNGLAVSNTQIDKLTGIYTPSVVLIFLFNVLSKCELHRLMKRNSRYCSLFKKLKTVVYSGSKNILAPELNKISCFSEDLTKSKDDVLCFSKLRRGAEVRNLYIYIILFISAMVFGLAFLISGNLYISVSSLCCMLVMMTPLSKDFCFKFIVNRLSKKLFKKEILLYKYSALDKIQSCENLIIDNDQFFEKNDFKLVKMKIFDYKQINNSIIYVSSLLKQADSVISKVFLDIIGNKDSMIKDVKNLKVDQNSGLTGIVDGKKIIFGSSDYLLDSNVVIPSKYVNLSKTILEDKTLKVLYIAIDGILAAMFLVKVIASGDIVRFLKLVEKNNLRITLNLKDAFISVDDVVGVYDVNKDLISEISDESKNDIVYKDLGILHTGKISSFITAVVESVRSRQFFDITNVLEIVSLVLTSCLVITFIALNAIGYITFARLILIQLFWFLIIFFIPNIHR